jgi:hypothetical protein
MTTMPPSPFLSDSVEPASSVSTDMEAAAPILAPPAFEGAAAEPSVNRYNAGPGYSDPATVKIPIDIALWKRNGWDITHKDEFDAALSEGNFLPNREDRTDDIPEIFRCGALMVEHHKRQARIDRIGLAAVAREIDEWQHEHDPLPIFLTRGA